MTETAIKAKIIEALRNQGFFFRAGAGPYSRAGISDILGVFEGRFMALEVKTPEAYNKKDHGLSPNQVRFLAAVNEAGGLGECVCSVQQALEAVHIRTNKKGPLA